MNKTRRLALAAVLAAAALTVFIIEAQIPPIVPIPGVKLGLANAVTLIAMALLGRKTAGAVFLIRLILGAVFTGSVSSLLFSAVGGVLAYLVMCLLIGVLPEKLVWVVSVLSALAHNAGQLIVACFVSGTTAMLVYAPALIAAGIVTGLFTGFCSVFVIKALRKTMVGK